MCDALEVPGIRPTNSEKVLRLFSLKERILNNTFINIFQCL